MMAEHVAADTFRVLEITIQSRGGTFASFVRLVNDIVKPLRAFFARTRHEYKRFNYVGEWHSHHSFALKPSPRDHASMQAIAMDSQLGAHFVVLLLVKLGLGGSLEHTVRVYKANGETYGGTVEIG